MSDEEERERLREYMKSSEFAEVYEATAKAIRDNDVEALAKILNRNNEQKAQEDAARFDNETTFYLNEGEWKDLNDKLAKPPRNIEALKELMKEDEDDG